MSIASLLLIACGLLAAIGIPLIVKVVPPNWFYGFRTPETLANRELWFEVNQFTGWGLLAAAASSAALLALGPDSTASSIAYEVSVFVLPLLIALGASFVYLRRLQRILSNGPTGSLQRRSSSSKS